MISLKKSLLLVTFLALSVLAQYEGGPSRKRAVVIPVGYGPPPGPLSPLPPVVPAVVYPARYQVVYPVRYQIIYPGSRYPISPVPYLYGR